MQPLPRAFYARPPLAVARDLLGCLLVYDAPDGRRAGRVVETEAYLDDDPAMHGWRATFGADGRVMPVGRAAGLFGAPATAYLYKVYYRSWLLNVVCAPEGTAGAVLLRAVEPVDGLEAMRRLRPAARRERDLTNGPGKLTEAFGLSVPDDVTRHPLHGHDLTTAPLWIAAGAPVPDASVEVSARVGLSRGVALPYRFFVAGHPYVSPGEPSDRRLARRTHRAEMDPGPRRDGIV